MKNPLAVASFALAIFAFYSLGADIAKFSAASEPRLPFVETIGWIFSHKNQVESVACFVFRYSRQNTFYFPSLLVFARARMQTAKLNVVFAAVC